MSRILHLCSQSPQYYAERLILAPGRYFLGRSSECALVIKDRTISRRHAEIEAYEAALLVKDLGSSNGTYVDSKRIDKSLVRLGQRLRFGRIAFLVMESSLTKSDRIDSQEATSSCADPPISADPQASASANPLDDELSLAQQRIFALAMEGHSEKHIASQLRLSAHTVHNHVQAIYRALGVHSRSELLAHQFHSERALRDRRRKRRKTS
ncbi:MAG: FHA domain-containing protein [Planctomycetes bacterium]|nr:FHA domain-containing protein [Planctomycetota bacterium]